jgi:diketogulonate reductase-like aldo/keto reductase
MKTEIPAITLNNGVMMPAFGLGVWQTADGKEVVSAVKAALESGYRLIDTAMIYGNEAGVGQAIRESAVPREEMFLTTKLWNADQGYTSTLEAFSGSLERLGVDYVDLYLIHWPVPSKDKYVETYKAMEEIYRSGRAKAIGVSNFEPEHLDRLLGETEIVPAVNQVELHPRFTQLVLRDYCHNKGIVIESYSPLGSTDSGILDEPVLREIGGAYGKTPAQVVLRWHIQLGLVVIPKSVHADRIRENVDIFDFELTDDDLKKIESLNTNTRVGSDPKTATF